MFLEEPCVSLCIILKHSGLSGCPVELLFWRIGEGALRCSLILSPSALPDSPYVFIRAVDMEALEVVDNHTFM